MLRVGGSQSQGKDILLTALLEKDQEPGSEKQLCPPDKPGHPPTAPPSVRSDVRWGWGLAQCRVILDPKVFITDNGAHHHRLEK